MTPVTSWVAAPRRPPSSSRDGWHLRRAARSVTDVGAWASASVASHGLVTPLVAAGSIMPALLTVCGLLAAGIAALSVLIGRDERRPRSFRASLQRGAPNVRVGHHEREETITLLQRHYGDGRLSSSDLETRVEAVWKAGVRSDLIDLLDDLPRLTDWDAAGERAR